MACALPTTMTSAAAAAATIVDNLFFFLAIPLQRLFFRIYEFIDRKLNQKAVQQKFLVSLLSH